MTMDTKLLEESTILQAGPPARVERIHIRFDLHVSSNRNFGGINQPQPDLALMGPQAAQPTSLGIQASSTLFRFTAPMFHRPSKRMQTILPGWD
jgi:hypothetical protein